MRILRLTFAAVCLTSRVATQSPENSWVLPAFPDFTTTITEGDQVNVTWNNDLWKWFDSYAPEANLTNVTLWVAAEQLAYAQVVQKSVDVTITFHLPWKAHLPANQTAQEQNWSFRFTEARTVFVEGNSTNYAQVDSPQFIYKGASSSSSSSTMPSATSTSSSLAATSSTGSPPPTSSLSNTSSSSNTLTPSAIAGVTIGAVALASLIAALIYLLLRLRRRDAQRKAEQARIQSFSDSLFASQQQQQPGSDMSTVGAGVDSIRPYYVQEQQQRQATDRLMEPHELPGGERHELDAGDTMDGKAENMPAAYGPYQLS